MAPSGEWSGQAEWEVRSLRESTSTADATGMQDTWRSAYISDIGPCTARRRVCRQLYRVDSAPPLRVA